MNLKKMLLKDKNIVVTGGSGRLGKHLIPLLEEEGARVIAPSRQEWDITKCSAPYIEDPDIVIHAAAYTNLTKAEENKIDCFDVNVTGTEKVANFARQNQAKLVYISSDYVTQDPSKLCHYAFTKKVGESMCLKSDLIIRTSFKERGTWGKDALTKVFHPVWTNADWVDVIAPKIVEAIKKDMSGVVNIGTEIKLLKDLAQQDYPYVELFPVNEADKLVGYYYPRNTTMKLSI